MLTIAHANDCFFNPTETFIYNYLTSFRQVAPIGFAFRLRHDTQFPYMFPMVELYSWKRLCQAWRGLHWHLQRAVGGHYDMTFARRKTFTALKKYDVRVLHAHFGYNGYRLLSVKRQTGLPLITTFYGADISSLAQMDIWKKAYRQLFKEGELFLVEGAHMQQRLIALGCPAQKTAIQRIALKFERYPYRQRTIQSAQPGLTILFCGRFIEKKGLLDALDAVRLTYQHDPRLTFRIIGDGELRPQVEAMLDRYQMRAYTHLLGFQSHDRMIAEMNAADLFLHPSVTAQDGDSEGGAPTTILEAQACGLPVISTTHADIPNVVVPGESALLAPERDVEALAAHLLALIKTPDRLAYMGEIGRRFIESTHNIAQEVTLLENRYHHLCQ